jgi:predicted GIY-YIG superfamily endonuclease
VGSHTVYLLHFDRPYRHAAHYLGIASDLEARIAAHRAGRGARLIEVITAAGIGFVIARTWNGGRDLERRLKNRKNSPQLCPICRQAQKEA